MNFSQELEHLKELAYFAIFLSIGPTISVILSGYKLGLGETPIVNWSWWIIATPALVVPIFLIVVGVIVTILVWGSYHYESQIS